MTFKSMLATAALVTAMGAGGMVVAQDAHMIGGKAVPADQMAEVQAKCDELRKVDSPSSVGTTSEAPASTATPNAGTPAPSAPANGSGGASTLPPAEGGAAATDTSTTGTGTEAWTADGSRIDLAKLTLAMCDAAGFAAPAN